MKDSGNTSNKCLFTGASSRK